MKWQASHKQACDAAAGCCPCELTAFQALTALASLFDHCNTVAGTSGLVSTSRQAGGRGPTDLQPEIRQSSDCAGWRDKRPPDSDPRTELPPETSLFRVRVMARVRVRWQFGLVVTHWSWSTKLRYAGPG